MKSFFLGICTLVLSSSIYGQYYEVGLNGGISTITKPNGSLYQGSKSNWSYAAQASFHYNITEEWQVGLSVGLTRWERTGQWPLRSTNGDSLGNRDVNFLIADRAVSTALQLNRVISFYKPHEAFARSSVYFGASVGATFIGNDGKITYTRQNPNTPVEYVYTSDFHYEAGYGFLLGLQVGYTYYINEHFGINADFAPKVSFVKTKDPRYAAANDTYHLFYFPTTIGLHYRFGYRKY